MSPALEAAPVDAVANRTPQEIMMFSIRPVHRALVNSLLVAGLSLCALGALGACSNEDAGDSRVGDSGGPGEAADGAADAAKDTAADGTSDTDGTSTRDDGGGAVNTFAYLVVEPEALDFGNHTPGTQYTHDLEIENAGNVALTLTSIALVDGSEAFGTNVNQALITPGQKKVIKVTFYALDEDGVYNDILRFESNAVNAARIDVPLVGVVSEAICQDNDGDLHGVGCVLGGDCNDSDPNVHVDAPELCNQLDDDCDGLHDEDFVGLGAACEVGFGACTAPGVKICADNQVSLQCSVNPVTGGDELCNDLDDDCDGATDEDFASKGTLCSVGLGACRVVDKFVCSDDGTTLVCNVTPIPPGPELCNDGVDNDCDGITDEGELEICADNVDNDCDGETDESGSAWGEAFFARSWYSETVALYPSNGDGTFEAPVPIDFPGDNRFGVVAVGDFDGDRWLDLVVSEIDVTGKTLCSSAADCTSNHRCWGGICQRLCTTDAQCTVEGEVCIDWSAQTNTATYNFCTPSRTISLARSGCAGDGDVTLDPLFELLPGEQLGPVIDADGNGHLDFAGLHHWNSKAGFVWMNDGTGGANAFTKITPAFTIAPWSTHGGYNGWDWVWGMVKTSKDLTGDGIADMLGRTLSSGGSPATLLWIFVGNGDGTFESPVVLDRNIPRPSNLVTANDFDGDGDQDIVAGLDDDGQPGGAWMLLNRNTEAGTAWASAYEIFDVAPSYNSGGEHPGTGWGTSYDFDGDDQPDVLAAWVPEECGSYLWSCPAISDPQHLCYQGKCRKVALIRNKTAQPCGVGTHCIDGQCAAGCAADCTGRTCGSDGCGGSCGACGGGQVCNPTGQCVVAVDCVPACDGAVCGDNGCGGTCGICGPAESCVQGQCQTGCVPNCAGRVCGDDGCGGHCAVFGDPEIITFDDNTAMNVESPTNVPPTQPEIAIIPEFPAGDDNLTCVVTTGSYDLDPVSYEFRWFRDGIFAKDAGTQAFIAPALTAGGERWRCVVRASDGIERSIPAEMTVEVTSP